MSPRDLALVAYRTLALWFVATGSASVLGQLVAWKQTAAQFEEEWVWVALAQAGLFLPIGAVTWLVGPALANATFRQSDPAVAPPNLRTLWSVATLGVGLLLVARAIPQLLSWLVIWRASRGDNFWAAAGDLQSGDGVVYSVAFKGQLASTLTELLIGGLCIVGADRLAEFIGRVRGEFRSTLSSDSDSDASS